MSMQDAAIAGPGLSTAALGPPRGASSPFAKLPKCYRHEPGHFDALAYRLGQRPRLGL